METEVHKYTVATEVVAGAEQLIQVQAEVQGEVAVAQEVIVIAPPQSAEPAGNVDLARQANMKSKFLDTLANPRFWLKESRVKALEDALVVPVFDDKSLQQFFNHAMDDLTTEAAIKSSREGKPAILPTEEEGKAEAWSRFIAQEKRLITKQLKKDGTKITEQIIEEMLQAKLATLTDKQGQ
ncbi:hypothetical protein E4633_15050 [Geomonas terrae]|uniref:Uncharacterized protein n=1 Tax=Geomonas terrae TaxID=2562681 RepID=A0A4S1CDS5_9BACT|nr:hypothetical protein [Geomonas terrae]TGU71624.1 hypothetical protein E4633_15050 [Geomonas terrae]